MTETYTSIDQIDFFDPQVIEDPFEANRIAREQAPVYQLPDTNIFMVSSYDLVVEAAKQPNVFSNDFSAAIEGEGAQVDEEIRAVVAEGWPQVDTLLTADPPVHTRFRKLVNMAFSPGRVNKMEDYVLNIVNELIDQFIDRGRCEFISDFAVPLPVTVIADQIGVPRADVGLCKQWSDAFAERLGGMISRERELECARQVVDFQKYMKDRLDERRADARDDILSDLVNARVDGERPLDDAEALSIVQQLLVAGNETTTNTMAGGMLLLIQNPDQLSKVQADPSLIKNMVEEVLRLESPTNSMWRVVKQDATLGGIAIPAGAQLLLRFGSANRDERRFPNPDTFDVTRKNAGTHLAFGRGVHTCIGAMLSRKEMNVAFRQLLARLKDFRLAPGENDLTHHSNILLRGLKSLTIEFDRA